MLGQVVINDAVAPFDRNPAIVPSNGDSNEMGTNESPKNSPDDGDKDSAKTTKNPMTKSERR